MKRKQAKHMQQSIVMCVTWRTGERREVGVDSRMWVTCIADGEPIFFMQLFVL